MERAIEVRIAHANLAPRVSHWALASVADEFGRHEVFGAVGVRADDQSRPAIESGMVFNFV